LVQHVFNLVVVVVVVIITALNSGCSHIMIIAVGNCQKLSLSLNFIQNPGYYAIAVLVGQMDDKIFLLLLLLLLFFQMLKG